MQPKLLTTFMEFWDQDQIEASQLGEEILMPTDFICLCLSKSSFPFHSQRQVCHHVQPWWDEGWERHMQKQRSAAIQRVCTHSYRAGNDPQIWATVCPHEGPRRLTPLWSGEWWAMVRADPQPGSTYVLLADGFFLLTVLRPPCSPAPSVLPPIFNS